MKHLSLQNLLCSSGHVKQGLLLTTFVVLNFISNILYYSKTFFIFSSDNVCQFVITNVCDLDMELFLSVKMFCSYTIEKFCNILPYYYFSAKTIDKIFHFLFTGKISLFIIQLKRNRIFM